jgi:hypothetical protein
MTCTVLGTVVAPEGHAVHHNALGDPVKLTITEPVDYKRHQPAVIPVHFAHDREWTLGHVVHLERSERFGLTAVAVIDSDIAELLLDGPFWWSDGITSERDGTYQRSNVRINELSLVRATANCRTRPVVVSAGGLNNGGPRGLNVYQRETFDRAVEANALVRYGAAPAHSVIHDLDELSIVDEYRTDRPAAKARLDAIAASFPSPRTPVRATEVRATRSSERPAKPEPKPKSLWNIDGKPVTYAQFMQRVREGFPDIAEAYDAYF